jgi:hypothetical protein
MRVQAMRKPLRSAFRGDPLPGLDPADAASAVEARARFDEPRRADGFDALGPPGEREVGERDGLEVGDRHCGSFSSAPSGSFSARSAARSGT